MVEISTKDSGKDLEYNLRKKIKGSFKCSKKIINNNLFKIN